MLPPAATSPTGPKAPEAKDETEAALDTMFSRLASLSPSPSPSVNTQAVAVVEGKQSESTSKELLHSHVANLAEDVTKSKENASPNSALADDQDIRGTKDMSLERLVEAYFEKAFEFLISLPTGHRAITVNPIQTVSSKLKQLYSSGAKIGSPEAIEEARSKVQDSVTAYVNRQHKSIAAGIIEKIIEDADGDFLRLYVNLVGEKALVLNNLDDVAGLSKAILDVLPKGSDKPISNDPMDKTSAWPTQEKRENGK